MVDDSLSCLAVYFYFLLDRPLGQVNWVKGQHHNFLSEGNADGILFVEQEVNAF